MIIGINNVKEIISRVNMTNDLLDSRARLFRDIVTHEDQILMYTYKRLDAKNGNRDITELLIWVEENEKRACEELRLEVQGINERLDIVNRVNVCFELTRIIYPFGYGIAFDTLQMKYGWDYIQGRYQISRSNIAMYQKRELRLILILYCMYEPNCNLLEEWYHRWMEIAHQDSKITLPKIVQNPDWILSKEELQKVIFYE